MQLTKQQERLLCLALDILTPEEIFKIATKVSDVEQAGYGEITIMIKKGHRYLLNTTVHESFQKAVTAVEEN